MATAQITKRSKKERLLGRFKRAAVTIIYLWMLFSLFELHRWIIFRQQNIASEEAYRLGFAFLNAFVLAKVIVLGEHLPVVERFRHKPLAYAILFKSALFSALLICFEIAEEVLVGAFHGQTIAQSIPRLGGGGVEGILLLGVIMFVVLIPFFAFKELSRVMGAQELKSIMFTSGPPDTRESRVA
jgi:hypothetical protein